MKYNIEKLSPAEYLNLVNAEIEPSDSTLKLHYYQLGETGYFVFANCSRGIKMTELQHFKETQTAELEKMFDEQTEVVNRYFKDLPDPIAPKPFVTSFLSF